MFTAKFWKDLGERAIRTFIQGAGAFVTAAGINLIQADAKTVIYGGLIAGGYAVVTSVVAYFRNPEQDSASLLDQPVVTDDEPGEHALPDEYNDGPGTVGESQAYVSAPILEEVNLTTPPSQPMGFVAQPSTRTVRVRDEKGRFVSRTFDA